MTEVYSYILLFFIGSILGWCMEVVCKLIQFHRFINRGFLQGPYCPVYGFGAVLLTVLLSRHTEDPVAVLILSMVICGTLEYLTSYLMEKLFHARWWDYSGKRFNLNGRVCADTLIPFGLLGLCMVYFVKPFLFGLFARLSFSVLRGLSVGLCAVLLVDFGVSLWALIRLHVRANTVQGDSTEQITGAVRDLIVSESVMVRRLLTAFPDVRLYNRHLRERLKKESERLRREAQARREAARQEIEENEKRMRANVEKLRQARRLRKGS
ncbi:MAG: hypothetical protein IJ246_13285 [Clostridia bacterium]|nr:hypothetical protein [Clostridia bacterium]